MRSSAVSRNGPMTGSGRPSTVGRGRPLHDVLKIFAAIKEAPVISEQAEEAARQAAAGLWGSVVR